MSKAESQGSIAHGQRYKLTMLEDFSGGLNLRSDQFNLGPNAVSYTHLTLPTKA